ncbi:MAG: TIGR00282 family metallophosphoesterase [Armatimonadia bacterium]
MKILFVGDVVGRPGRRAVAIGVPEIVKKYGCEFVIINGENAAAGYGVTPKTADELLAAGADVLTTGNHVYAPKEAATMLEMYPQILRPANFPPGNPGRGSAIFEAPNGAGIGVINLIGRVFMEPADCPFRTADAELERLKGADVTIVDFHAEATSEKQALGYYLDGRVTAVIGTHTHVGTCDERVLDGGTAYITDCGMTGPINTVIGVDRNTVVRKFVTGMPARFEVPKGGEAVLSAVVVEVDLDKGGAKDIQRVSLRISDRNPDLVEV